MCVDSEIPLLLGLIVLGERAHWDLCLRSSETCEITNEVFAAAFCHRAYSIPLCAMVYWMRERSERGKVQLHFTSARVVRLLHPFPEAF
jgi:hypothetical protein